jgi:hypothetical protein
MPPKEKYSKKVHAHIRYKLSNGKIVPGITTVLNLHAKNALVKWSNDLGLRGISVGSYVDDLAAIGTLAHAMITDKLSGIPTETADYSDNQISLAENSALSFWEWEKDHRIEEVYFCERPLVSEVDKYGGTLDIYAKVNGKKEIIDLKTGSGIYDEHKWQVATLKKLLEENGYSVDGTRIVNIPRSEDEGFMEAILTEDEHRKGWEIFTHLLAIYYLKKK